jgi:hypothetical protein
MLQSANQEILEKIPALPPKRPAAATHKPATRTPPLPRAPIPNP